MEYLVISDIHLRNKFENKKMHFLMNLIKEYQNIILNGDFYEARYINAEKFINGKYKPLLDLLRNKNTSYIYGNHDPKDHSEKVAEYVSKNQYDYLKLKVGETYFHIEHGHSLGLKKDLSSDAWFHIMDYFSDEIQKYFNFLVVYLGNKWNKLIKQHRSIHELIQDFEYLIVGHTHVKVMELEEKFINGGYIKYGRGSYLVLSDIKPVELKQVRY